jgi:hypothetical protein
MPSNQIMKGYRFYSMLLHIKIHIVADETKTEALSKELP